MGKKLMIADDDPEVVEQFRNAAAHEGYVTLWASDGEEALRMFRAGAADAIVMDVMLPGINGLDVCRRIRQTSGVPVIRVSSRDSEDDIVRGLEAGADDYVLKPFSPREVMTRVKAVLRRCAARQEPKDSRRVEVAGLVIDMNSYEAFVNGVQIPLTKKEIEILWLFATNPGKVFTRDQLLESVWGYEYFGNTRTVDTHIKRIRTKLGLNDASGFDIRTVWGVGYRFELK